MLVIKKIMIVLACILMSGVRDKSEDTTFKFLFPANETRKVDLEFQDQRTTLTFVPWDSLRVASVSLALSGGKYACLWVGEMPYVIWLEAGKPWTARFEGNRWFFEGVGANVNNYLNKYDVEQIYFIDYYRITNREFREKLDRVMNKREEALRVASLDSGFVKQERKDRYFGLRSPQDKIRSIPSSLLFSKKSHSERDSVSESTIIFIVKFPSHYWSAPSGPQVLRVYLKR